MRKKETMKHKGKERERKKKKAETERKKELDTFKARVAQLVFNKIFDWNLFFSESNLGGDCQAEQYAAISLSNPEQDLLRAQLSSEGPQFPGKFSSQTFLQINDKIQKHFNTKLVVNNKTNNQTIARNFINSQRGEGGRGGGARVQKTSS
jgi:hypothetical protein